MDCPEENDERKQPGRKEPLDEARSRDDAHGA
jgi:hypothetical protein